MGNGCRNQVGQEDGGYPVEETFQYGVFELAEVEYGSTGETANEVGEEVFYDWFFCSI